MKDRQLTVVDDQEAQASLQALIVTAEDKLNAEVASITYDGGANVARTTEIPLK